MITFEQAKQIQDLKHNEAEEAEKIAREARSKAYSAILHAFADNCKELLNNAKTGQMFKTELNIKKQKYFWFVNALSENEWVIAYINGTQVRFYTLTYDKIYDMARSREFRMENKFLEFRYASEDEYNPASEFIGFDECLVFTLGVAGNNKHKHIKTNFISEAIKYVNDLIWFNEDGGCDASMFHITEKQFRAKRNQLEVALKEMYDVKNM